MSLPTKVRAAGEDSQNLIKKNPWREALPHLQATDLTSFSQLIQDLIGGAVRRNTFTQWELELLLDLQTCRIRKAGRPEMLRRYLRAVQLQSSRNPSSAPLRLSTFLLWEAARRNHPDDSAMPAETAEAAPGLSSK